MRPLRRILRAKRHSLINDWVTDRSLGNEQRQWGAGRHHDLNSLLYGAVKCVRSWDPMNATDHSVCGAIFNFDFSTDGSILVAACENKSILMFDPLNGKMIGSRFLAHVKEVNCVKFLDSRMFATCSDDTMVRLWDCRSLKHEVLTLSRHEGWVKNIDYCNGFLWSSGFDGNIFKWDINKFSSSSTEDHCQTVLHVDSLMRSRLTPDGSKLIISTQAGFPFVIHNLDCMTVAKDLAPAKRTLSSIPLKAKNKLSRRNYVEVIKDFPTGCKVDYVFSIDVHPRVQCIVSRSALVDQRAEATCIHDIRENKQTYRSSNAAARFVQSDDVDLRKGLLEEASRMPDNSNEEGVHPNEGTPVTAAAVDVITLRDLMRPHTQDRTSPLTVLHNTLTHYIDEPISRHGFIKEIGFGAGGRIVCSPFGHGVRLLALNSSCGELADCVMDQPVPPVQMHEVAANMSHSAVVLCTKFSPTHALFVTGCLKGKVDFHQPVF